MSTTLGAVAEGSIVYLNESGVAVPFYVAKHNYESALNGSGRTLLVRKNLYDTRVWNSAAVNTYASSTIDAWLNSTWILLLDDFVQSAAGTTKFYYTVGNGDRTITALSRAAFLLSVAEYGLTNTNFNAEGSALPIASELLRGYLDGTLTRHWTRSANLSISKYAAALSNPTSVDPGVIERLYQNVSSQKHGSRPCITLPDDMGVDDSNNITVSSYTYTKLEYIESSGTQWIDTGFVPNQDTRVVFDFEYTKAVSGAQQGVFGSRIALRNAMYLMWTQNGNTGWRDGYGTELKYPIGSTISGRVVVDKNKNALSINGTVVYTATYATFNSTYSLYLLTTNNAGSPMIESYPTYARIYACQIYDNGTLVRDLVPAKRSDGTVGLYDKVNDRFYTNSGTGAFTAGPEIVAGRSLAKIDDTEYPLVQGYVRVNGISYPMLYALVLIDDAEYTAPFGDAQQTISFYIETDNDSGVYEEYQAENGMTWAEWVESEYNTDGFYVKTYGNYTWIERIINNTAISVQDTSGDDVQPSDTIVSDYQYQAAWVI